MDKDKAVNLKLDPEIHKAAKVEAAKQGITFRKFVEEALRRAIPLSPETEHLFFPKQALKEKIKEGK